VKQNRFASEWLHKLVTVFTLRCLTKRCGEEAADHWFWGMTPMPAALPLPHQYVLAVRMLFYGPKDCWQIAKEYEDYIDYIWRKYKRDHPEEFEEKPWQKNRKSRAS